LAENSVKNDSYRIKLAERHCTYFPLHDSPSLRYLGNQIDCCKILGFDNGDYEEYRLLGCVTV
jgi:hypothetical protein